MRPNYFMFMGYLKTGGGGGVRAKPLKPSGFVTAGPTFCHPYLCPNCLWRLPGIRTEGGILTQTTTAIAMLYDLEKASYFFLLYISESKYLHSICIEYNIMNFRVIIVYIHGHCVVNIFRDA